MVFTGYHQGERFWDAYRAHQSLDLLRDDILTDPWYRVPQTVHESVLYFAVSACDPAAAALLIDLGESPNLPDDSGFPLLHHAVDLAEEQHEFPDSLRVIELLLKGGADPNRLGMDGTALHRAAGWGLIDVARLLLQHGANIEARMLVDGELTPLMHATLSDEPQMVAFLLSAGADPLARCAAYMGSLTAAELKQRGAWEFFE